MIGMGIINSDDTRNVLDRLARRGFSATVTGTTGGFCVGNTTIFCGVTTEGRRVLSIFRESCRAGFKHMTPLPPVMEPGRCTSHAVESTWAATIFVLDVAHFEDLITDRSLRRPYHHPCRHGIAAAHVRHGLSISSGLSPRSSRSTISVISASSGSPSHRSSCA